MKSAVFMLANQLHYRKGFSRSLALKTAWRMAKQGEFDTKVTGVTIGRRQTALQRLQHYSPEQINVVLVQEANNRTDTAAVAVYVEVAGKGRYQIGYLPRETAQIWCSLVGSGKVNGQLKAIVGGGRRNLGARIKLNLAA